VRRPLRIPVQSLKQGQSQFEYVLEPRELDFQPREVSENPSFEFIVGPVQVFATIVRSGNRLLVTGTVRYRARLECALCGSEYESDFEEPLSAEFAGVEDARVERELDDEDSERLQLQGNFLDLQTLVHDAIHLAVPMAPVCRPDCKGLCPECGADLNKVSCGCSTKARSRAARG
jgi:uncharacterized protein